MWNFKTDDLVEIKSRLLIKRSCGGRKGEIEKRGPIGKI